MKTLSDVYNQIVLTEAEKHNSLQNPTSDEIGNLKPKQALFGETPKVTEGPDKAKLASGPSYQQTTGTAGSPKVSNQKMPNSGAAKSPSVKSGKEMKDTDVDPSENEDKDEDDDSETTNKKQKLKKEHFTMSAFDTLFKKTIIEELEDEAPVNEPVDDTGAEAAIEDIEDIDSEEGELEDEEGDLISDLKDLQDKLASILDKLEGSLEEGDVDGEEYSEEDFDGEFGPEEGEESPVQEESAKLTALNSSKGKSLSKKDNKVKGRLSKVKGGKANAGKLKHEPTPKALGDRKGSLQKGLTVKSGITKGDFIK